MGVNSSKMGDFIHCNRYSNHKIPHPNTGNVFQSENMDPHGRFLAHRFVYCQDLPFWLEIQRVFWRISFIDEWWWNEGDCSRKWPHFQSSLTFPVIMQSDEEMLRNFGRYFYNEMLFRLAQPSSIRTKDPLYLQPRLSTKCNYNT